MIILSLTILICLVVLLIIGVSVNQHGWTNLYLIPLSLALVSLILGVVGFLA